MIEHKDGDGHVSIIKARGNKHKVAKVVLPKDLEVILGCFFVCFCFPGFTKHK